MPLVRLGGALIQLYSHDYMYIRFIQYGYIQLNIHTRTFYILSICKLACIEECEPTSIICFKSQGTIFPYQSLGDPTPLGQVKPEAILEEAPQVAGDVLACIFLLYMQCFKGRKCHLRR